MTFLPFLSFSPLNHVFDGAPFNFHYEKYLMKYILEFSFLNIFWIVRFKRYFWSENILWNTYSKICFLKKKTIEFFFQDSIIILMKDNLRFISFIGVHEIKREVQEEITIFLCFLLAYDNFGGLLYLKSWFSMQNSKFHIWNIVYIK